MTSSAATTAQARSRVAHRHQPPGQVAVVFNPTKAADPAEAKQEICAALAAAGFPDPEWLETTVEDPGTIMLRTAVEGGAELVFACGGDGTVMACVSALAGTDVPLAVLPSGTGNLLARNFDIPLETKDAIDLALSGQRRRIDVGAVGELRFAVMAGIGFDAAMMRDAPERLKARIGWPAYAVAAFKHLREPRHRMTVTLDDRPPLRRRARAVLVGNLGELQGNLLVLPDALCDDGELDVAILRARTLRDWVQLAAAVVRRHKDRHRLETFRAARVLVEVDRPLPTQLDGDVQQETDRFEAVMHPAALTLCVPAGTVDSCACGEGAA